MTSFRTKVNAGVCKHLVSTKAKAHAAFGLSINIVQLSGIAKSLLTLMLMFVVY